MDDLILTANPCCDTNSTCAGTSIPCDNDVEENTNIKFAKLAAVLQDSVLHSWKLHLKAKKYSIHVILEEYYNEAFDIIDGLIEHYQGICNCNIIDNVTIDIDKNDDPVTYFTDIKNYIIKFVNEPTNFNEKTFEIKSDIDDLLRLIDSTLYKLINLVESKIKSFDAFIYEKI